MNEEIIYYQGYRSPRALERERQEKEEVSRLESIEMEKRYTEQMKKGSGEFMTEEELIALKNRKYGFKTLRRGAASNNPEDIERAAW